MTITLDRIDVFPIKSLDGLSLEEAVVLPSGALEFDRRWRLVDMEHRVVNAKRTAAIHPIRARYDLDARTVELSHDINDAVDCFSDRPVRSLSTEVFSLEPGSRGPCEWLSEALGIDVLLEERSDGGFPDDLDSPGPTLISTATLIEVARWFSFSLAEARRRFRTNLEVGGCEAFWEDSLASPASDISTGSLTNGQFSIGSDQESWVHFQATGICRRCIVVSRDSRSGFHSEHFRDVFESRRRVAISRRNGNVVLENLYSLAINMKSAPFQEVQRSQKNRSIAVGNPLFLKLMRPRA